MLNLDIAIVGGLIGTFAAILVLQVWEVARPSQNHIGIVSLIGSAFTPKTFGQQLIGRSVLLFIGVFYGIFTSAVIYAFEVEATAWLYGAIVSVCLWVLTGVSLTYFRLLHPRIRKGEIKAPGPFALSYSRQHAAMLLIAHLIFGLVCGAVYGNIT